MTLLEEDRGEDGYEEDDQGDPGPNAGDIEEAVTFTAEAEVDEGSVEVVGWGRGWNKDASVLQGITLDAPYNTHTNTKFLELMLVHKLEAR